MILLQTDPQYTVQRLQKDPQKIRRIRLVPSQSNSLCRRFMIFTAGLIATVAALMVIPPKAIAQPLSNSKHSDPLDRFYSIDSLLRAPNTSRTAAGTPGPAYWQQRVDYNISVTLDDRNQTITGKCGVTYHNRSPRTMTYLWVQLDQNRFRPESVAVASGQAPTLAPKSDFRTLRSVIMESTFEGGFDIREVVDANDRKLSFRIDDTMMRVDLPKPLRTGQSFRFAIDYHYQLVDATSIRARGGYEYFEKDKNYIYQIAQWYPRVAAYTDYSGWQHDPFLGTGEFALEFGDFHVEITAPEDMVVASTGKLTNPDAVLQPKWRQRLKEAASATRPMMIITPEEAEANQESQKRSTKTWVFEAANVRDFAFAVSRKFIWDAMPVKLDSRTVMAMSFYPPEAEPLWSQYSTEAVAHALEVYSRHTFDYPYHYAISVNGPIFGMEYPMVAFSSPRPESDGTYSRRTKYGLISVIIHEVGHNFFPMIVNTDERQWAWMDEGLNTFLQFLAEQEWEEAYPSRRGFAEKITRYMQGSNQRPIMTASDEVLQLGPNAYGKPAAALNVLRETVLGRERFDFAFRHYANTWKFKRPTPADFFRSIEDAAGTELDWFWRGWFFTTDHVDVSIDQVELFLIDPGDPDLSRERQRAEEEKRPGNLTELRNVNLRRRLQWKPWLQDFYNDPSFDEDAVDEADRQAYQEFLDRLTDEERELLHRRSRFYVFTFRNDGGLVTPIPLRVDYSDGSSDQVTLPAEIWRRNGKEVRKLWITEKEVKQILVDPHREIADVQPKNNQWPPDVEVQRFKLKKEEKKKNPMQKAKSNEQ